MKPAPGTYRLTGASGLSTDMRVYDDGTGTYAEAVQGTYAYDFELDAFILHNPNITIRCLGFDEKTGTGAFVALVNGGQPHSGTCVKLP